VRARTSHGEEHFRGVILLGMSTVQACSRSIFSTFFARRQQRRDLWLPVYCDNLLQRLHYLVFTVIILPILSLGISEIWTVIAEPVKAYLLSNRLGGQRRKFPQPVRSGWQTEHGFRTFYLEMWSHGTNIQLIFGAVKTVLGQGLS